VSGDRRLPDALARPDHGQRRDAERLERRRVEAEVRALVGNPACEREARKQHARARVEDGLPREIHDDVGPVLVERGLEVAQHGDAVLVVAAQLLRPSDQHGRRELVRELGQRVPHDRRVVLAVDHRDRPHRVVTSRSMRRVYFW
jgi:hypothetical protein